MFETCQLIRNDLFIKYRIYCIQLYFTLETSINQAYIKGQTERLTQIIIQA